MRNDNPEHRLSVSISEYLRLQYPKVLFHFDFGSGCKMTIGQAVQQAKLNNCKWLDLFIAKPKSLKAGLVCYGLFIEIKAEGNGPYLKDGITLKKNKHLEQQYDMICRLKLEGYEAMFCTGFEEVKGVIDKYLLS